MNVLTSLETDTSGFAGHGCFDGVDGAHQAHKAEDDGLGDTHLAEGDEVDGC